MCYLIHSDQQPVVISDDGRQCLYKDTQTVTEDEKYWDEDAVSYVSCELAATNNWPIIESNGQFCTVRKPVEKTRQIEVQKTVNVTACCPGYVGDQCQDAVCTTACANDGVCVGPNQCDCGNSGYSGTFCDERKFHLFPLHVSLNSCFQAIKIT